MLVKDADSTMPLTDRLAIDRTSLANERTLLAYIRTAIMLAVSGITFIKFFPEIRVAHFLGWSLLPLSLVLAALGLSRFMHVARRLRHGG